MNPALFFIGNDHIGQKSFGKLHPLSGRRVSNVVEICSEMGWLSKDDIIRSTAAPIDVLAGYHDLDYIKAIEKCDRLGVVPPEIREKYRLGTMENPLFKGLFKRASTTVGGSILAAEMVANGGTAFHPSGGTHHGQRDKASGFCYFNDPVFAIHTFLDQGLKSVVYVDIDAHFGDGVQAAFVDEERVHTFSIHEENRWPYTGKIDDVGGGRSFNMPVQKGFNDSEFDFLLENSVYPKIKDIAPDALVITMGADALYGDPLSKMGLSNLALWDAVMSLKQMSPRTVIVGGGGYNPWTTVRCWAGMWAKLSGADVSAELTPNVQKLFSNFESDLVDEDEVENIWLTTIADQPREGDIRQAVIDLTKQLDKIHIA